GTKETPSHLVRHLVFPVARSSSARHVANPLSTRMKRTPSPSRFRRTRRPEGPGSVDYLPSCAECPEKTDSVYRCPTAAVASRLGRAVPRARLEGQRKEKLDELALGPERCPPMKQPPRHPLGERAVAHCSRKQLWRIKATPINR
ncbi:unnamed protein product, partial [Ixodes persulcatus]